MKSAFKALACALMIICLFSACNPSHPLSAADERVADLYIQLSKLQSTIPAHNPAYQDSARKIIALSGLTEKEYRETIAYFCEEPERWEAFYKEVLNRLKNDESPPLSSQQ